MWQAKEFVEWCSVESKLTHRVVIVISNAFKKIIYILISKLLSVSKQICDLPTSLLAGCIVFISCIVWPLAQTIFITTRCFHTPCYFNASKPHCILFMCAHGTITIEVYSVHHIFKLYTVPTLMLNMWASFHTQWLLSIVHITAHWDSENICEWVTYQD